MLTREAYVHSKFKRGQAGGDMPRPFILKVNYGGHYGGVRVQAMLDWGLPYKSRVWGCGNVVSKQARLVLKALKVDSLGQHRVVPG